MDNVTYTGVLVCRKCCNKTREFKWDDQSETIKCANCGWVVPEQLSEYIDLEVW